MKIQSSFYFFKRLFQTKNQAINTLQPLTECSERSVFLCRFAVRFIAFRATFVAQRKADVNDKNFYR